MLPSKSSRDVPTQSSHNIRDGGVAHTSSLTEILTINPRRPSSDDDDDRGRLSVNDKTSRLSQVIPDIEEVGKLISYAKALDVLIENAREHGDDDDDWDELGRKSKEAWAEIKRRNREQRKVLEAIMITAPGAAGDSTQP